MSPPSPDGGHRRDGPGGTRADDIGANYRLNGSARAHLDATSFPASTGWSIGGLRLSGDGYPRTPAERVPGHTLR